MDVLHALTYTGKNTDGAAIADWWNRRITCESLKGALGSSPVLIVNPPEGGLHSDYDAEEFLKRELFGNPVGTVLAVPFSATVPVESGAESRSYAAMKRAIDRAAAIETKGHAAITGAKSKTVGCKHCGSKVSRSFVGSISCPVCGASLLPAGTQVRYTDLRAEIAECVSSILAARQSAKLKAGTYYMVAARFPGDFFDADPFVARGALGATGGNDGE